MTMLTETDQINLFKLCTLRSMLKLEMRGLIRSRAPTALSTLRKMGYKGNRVTVLVQVLNDISDGFDQLGKDWNENVTVIK